MHIKDLSMQRLAVFLAALFFLPVLVAINATAQDRPNTILVMDGSGSMWGQIDGVNKIVIAREVVADILQSFPADENLGLTVYGHRTEGDCTDIETVVAPAPGTAAAIVDAVNSINPRGKTPMTDAVIAAAEALGYEDAPATVILVSDGIETCNPDPCEAARALEKAGAEFTAHVIGFDVNDAEAIGQLQCLAEETGGVFLSASNADELSAALEQVAVAEPEPAPEPALTPVTLEAVIGEGGPRITDPVFWTITPAPETDGGSLDGNPLTLELEAGAYTVTGTWSVAEQTQEVDISVLGSDPRTVTLVFEKPVPGATIVAPVTAVAGSTVEVAWEGPDAQNDYIAVSEPNDDGYANYTYTREGTPLGLLMPTEPGEYEVRYVLNEGRVVLATAAISVTPVEASIVAPATAAAGSDIEVAWEGPDYQNDYIGISVPDEEGYETYTYTREGSPLDLTMPTEPGEYELRYYIGQDRTVIARASITLQDVGAKIVAPATAAAGSDIEVAWEGPDYRNDYIGVSMPDDEGYEAYTYTREGSPLDLTMPTEPGQYELRYYVGQDRKVLARAPITVESVGANLVAPDEAVAGSDIEVAWEGPDYRNDFIAISEPG
jgi:Ca-activated chloride channel family protein